MDLALLDTDILSELLKQRNTLVMAKATAYLRQHGQIAICTISRFEVLRGYKKKKATRQLARFQLLCQKSMVLNLTDTIIERAADLWAYGYAHGNPIGDADVLIGATALEHGRTLVTGNEGHFNWMPGLFVENWRR